MFHIIMAGAEKTPLTFERYAASDTNVPVGM
jgi:hypothetical protein